MALTAHTNTTIAEIAALLKEQRSFAICAHMGPDGDALGSQLALAEALRLLGKQVTCVLARDEVVDSTFGFLKGFDGLVPAASFDEPIDAFVTVDVPSRERIVDAAPLLDKASLTVTIDHHGADVLMGEHTYADTASASTTMIVWDVIKALGVEPTSDIATCCYTGLMTDTGRFQYQNADAAAFAYASEMVAAGAQADVISKAIYQNRRLASVKLEAMALDRIVVGAQGAFALTWLTLDDFAACDAVKADGEPIIDVIRSLEGIRVACVLREQDEIIRGSFRAKDDTDVAAIARDYEGGGHKAAAGFTLHCSMDEARELIAARLEAELGACRG